MKIQRNIPLTRQFTYDYAAIDGKAIGDIEDVLYTWQINKGDKDDAYLLKRYTVSGITIDDGTKLFTVQIANTDYGSVLDGHKYKEIFSIKYTGDASFRDYVLQNRNGGDSEIEIEGAWVQLTS